MRVIRRSHLLAALRVVLATAFLLASSCGGTATQPEGTGGRNTLASLPPPRPIPPPPAAHVAREVTAARDVAEPAPSPLPVIAQVAPDEFRALPALSNDGARLAVAVNPAFSGRVGPGLVVVVGVEGAQVNAVYRVAEQLAEVNVMLEAGGFLTLGKVAEFWPRDLDASGPEFVDPWASASDAPVVDGEGFAGDIVFRDPASPRNANRRGTLFEGPETLGLSIRETQGGSVYRADVSYVPPSFNSIPRRCRASFMPATVKVFAAPGRDLLVVHETWGSGSGECAPFRLVLLGAASGDGPSPQRVVDESDIPLPP